MHNIKSPSYREGDFACVVCEVSFKCERQQYNSQRIKNDQRKYFLGLWKRMHQNIDRIDDRNDSRTNEISSYHSFLLTVRRGGIEPPTVGLNEKMLHQPAACGGIQRLIDQCVGAFVLLAWYVRERDLAKADLEVPYFYKVFLHLQIF